MTRQMLTILCVLCAAVLLTGCKDDAVTAAAGEGILNGTVYDGSSRIALSGVTIQAQPAGVSAQTFLTTGDGNFSFTFSVDSAITLSVRFIKGGYNDTTFTVVLRSGNVNSVTVFMTPSSIV